MGHRRKRKNAEPKEGADKLVVTPGGPRSANLVHEVSVGQAVYSAREGGYIVADQQVLTPGGFRSQSLVHRIDPGFGVRLDNNVHKKVELATNQILDLPAAAGGFVPAWPVKRQLHGPGASAPGALPQLGSGWITYAWWDSGATPITSFSTTWTVPQAPSTYSGQTIFLFNGIQNTGSNFGILQPVLQYGPSAAGGGNYWSIASWYVTSGGQAFHTPLVTVRAGDVLVGVMNQTAVSGALYSYTSAFKGIANTSLPVQNIAQLHWANETLEAYEVNLASDYPAVNDTLFDAVDIVVGASHPALSWTPVNAVTDTGQHCLVRSDANSGGEVDLWYRAARRSILWHTADGRISLWKVDDHGNQVNYKEHGPFAGWTPLHCANNKVLWRNVDGRISLWTVDDQGNQLEYKEQGPFGGWTAINYASDRILWGTADSRISIWKIDEHGNQVNYKEHGPFAGWTPLQCANNKVLWRNVDGRISLWTLDDNGNQVSYKEHGPFSGWTALNYCDSRILWSKADGRISIWKVDDNGNQVNYKEHGPFAGWTPLNCSRDRILWRNADGRISLWVIDDSGNQVSYKEHGPFGGWTALNYSD